MKRLIWVLWVVTLPVGCGPRPWAAQMRIKPPDPTVPPFDAGGIYRTMGFVADSGPMRFVGALRYLAGATPDSTLVVFSASLPNRALSFRSEGDDFLAEYHVDVGFRGDSGPLRQITRNETVRVHSVQETRRADESVVFQEFFSVAPGKYRVTVAVSDEHGTGHSQQATTDTVPRFDTLALSDPIPLYQSGGRARRTAVPQFVVNPRSTQSLGLDTLRFYVEGYRQRAGTRVAARITDQDTVELWRDTLTLTGDTLLSQARMSIAPGTLPLGRAELTMQVVGSSARPMRAPLMVGFSDLWAITSFEQLVNLLRYFSQHDLVAKLKATPKDQRGPAWREFYRTTDPKPATPQNEVIDEYFHRLETANRRFREFTSPGWLTDRGEVFITLGEPDKTQETPGVANAGLRWEYTEPSVTLVFEDQTGLGQYKLTPESRAQYETAVAGLHKTSEASTR